MSDEKQEQGLKKKGKESKLDEALAELEKAKADAAHWKNEYYKAYADTQNLRKSLEEDKRTAVRYRAEGFIEGLLPALDGFHMALSVPPKSEEMKNFLLGFGYIYNQIEKVLSDEGVTPITPNVGDQFDPNTMHAIDTVETDGEADKISVVHAKGFKLHDRLIRPAMVTVTVKKAEEKPAETVAEEEKPQQNPDEMKKEKNAAEEATVHKA